MPHNPYKVPTAQVQPQKSGPRKATLKSQLANLKVTLLYSPSIDDLNKYIPGWATLTWSDEAGKGPVFEAVKDMATDLSLGGYILPTVLETINVVFLLEGLSQIDVTHILRHRTMSYSGQSTDARDCRDDGFVLPPELYIESKFKDRIAKLHQDAIDLYIDMVENDDVSREHARYVLPRSSETSLYMRGNLKDILHLIHTRLDRQTQPMSDNIIAAKLAIELVKVYPQLKPMFDFDPVSKFYLKSVQTPVAHAIHPPEGNNDIFEWAYGDFISPKKKSEYIGANIYFEIMAELTNELNSL